MFGIPQFFKKMFSTSSEKELTKSLVDAKLGKLECTYKLSDTFFSWDGELTQTKGKEPICISIDGDLNGPFSDALHKVYQIIDSVLQINFDIQKALDTRFPEKKINLSRDFYLEDISIFKDEETGVLDYELEYFSDKSDFMISVEFVNDTINGIDFY